MWFDSTMGFPGEGPEGTEYPVPRLDPLVWAAATLMETNNEHGVPDLDEWCRRHNLMWSDEQQGTFLDLIPDHHAEKEVLQEEGEVRPDGRAFNPREVGTRLPSRPLWPDGAPAAPSGNNCQSRHRRPNTARRPTKSAAREARHTVCCANTNAWSTGQCMLEWFQARGSAPTFVALQETRLEKPAFGSAQSYARGQGYTCALGAARRTGPAQLETSGGTAVLGRGHIAASQAGLPADDRITACRYGLGKHIQLVVISVYAHVGVGLAGPNLDLLQRLGELVTSLREPWIIAGDWNIDATLFLQEDWLGKVRGHLLQPPVATCNEATIDYLIIADVLKCHVEKIEVLEQAPMSPHAPVLVTFKALGRLGTMQKRRVWSSFPTEAPVGPRLQDPPLNLTWVPGTSLGDTEIEKAWTQWMTAAEQALCRAHGLDPTEPGTAKAYCGRAEGFQLMRVPIRDELRRPHRGSFGADTLAWRSLQGFLRRRLGLRTTPARENG